ncbi:GNAT family N-acetyltransferase [Uliginosibacterium sp. H3]|uniref:GNAT family N-acetyltransferase n=1 Tax=Uliginosibacterium silvisoli TaxID=3114758 RepID=A0ABU6K1T4_9RHOO|nr:GNAT family N-acetyltransferase [Uliginosibacterium sp. H3]
MGQIKFAQGKASAAQIGKHLFACNAAFFPALNERVDISSYAEKIAINALCFEAWGDGELIGLAAAYCNSPDKEIAFVSNVSVLSAWQGEGIASRLLNQCITHVKNLGFSRLNLVVSERNVVAVILYEKYQFVTARKADGMLNMTLDLRGQE